MRRPTRVCLGWLVALAPLVGCGFFEANHAPTGTQGGNGDAGAGGGGGAHATEAGTSFDAGSDAGGQSNATGGRSGSAGSAGTDAMTPVGDAASDAGPVIDSGPAPCDEHASPRDQRCLISDTYAVFVSQSGQASADATLAAPADTLARGIAAARTRALPRVIVCDGDYDDQIVLDGLDAAIAIYGGFDCRGKGPWKPSATGVTRIAPAKGAAVEVRNSDAKISIEHVELDSSAATKPGESSIAAIFEKAKDVTLNEVTLSAGTGAQGGDGSLQPFTFPLTVACTGGANDAMCIAGKPASGTDSGARRNFTCPAADQTFGGGGGDGGPSAQSGEDGFPDLGMGAGGPGGAPCTGGGNGAGGMPGEQGPGAAVLGSIVNGTWAPAPGTAGKSGQVGQGGGGGGATKTGGGGGGGGGGCGGAPGLGGQGGGGSIALLAIASNITLQGSKVVASDAGNGGAGAAAQAGQSVGGSGGNGADNACGGGIGGPGGSGGPGGGGAGGISAGIVYQGTAPKLDKATTVTTGDAGNAGAGGHAGANDGIAGSSKAQLELK